MGSMDDLCGEPRISISGPSGLLAAVPNMLGFHPTDSLVVMCFTGERYVLGPVARVDLPRGRDPELVRYLTGTALTHADCVAVVCYPRRRRRPAILDDLIAELGNAGVGVMTALIVHAGRVWEAPSARPLRLADSLPAPTQDDPTVQALAAANALTGRVVLADREQLRASIAGPGGSRRRVAEEAFTAVAQGIGAHLPDITPVVTDHPPHRVDPGSDGSDGSDGFDGFDGPGAIAPLPDRVNRVIDCALIEVSALGTLDVHLAAELAVACLDRSVRDGVLIRGVFELDRGWLSMLIAVATWTPNPWAAGVCAVLTAIAYRHGDGALAQVSADRCLLAEPENSLIQLLIAMMSAGLPPQALDGMLVRPDEFDSDGFSCDFDSLDFDSHEFGSHDFDSDDGNAVA